MTQYGIFLEFQRDTDSAFDVNLLGHRFDGFDEAINHLETMSFNRTEELHGETFWAVDEDELPDGYKLLVYYVDEIDDYDLKYYAI